jgi:hypothetical protein
LGLKLTKLIALVFNYICNLHHAPTSNPWCFLLRSLRQLSKGIIGMRGAVVLEEYDLNRFSGLLGF